MAVRFSADGQNYTSTSASIGPPLTMMCWGLISVDRNTFSCFVQVDNAGITGTFMLECRNSGTLLGLYSDPEGAWIDGADMAVGTWYKMAGTWAADGTAIMYQAAAGAALVNEGTDNYTVPGTLPTVTRIGEDVYNSDWLNGRVANVKIYSAVLTATEIENELSQYAPVRTANLYRWHPLLAPDTVDYSGNARTLSIVGAGASREDGPPIPWHRLGPRLILPPGTAATTASAENSAGTGEANLTASKVVPVAGDNSVTGTANDSAIAVTDAPRPVRRMFAVPRAANF